MDRAVNEKDATSRVFITRGDLRADRGRRDSAEVGSRVSAVNVELDRIRNQVRADQVEFMQRTSMARRWHRVKPARLELASLPVQRAGSSRPTSCTRTTESSATIETSRESCRSPGWLARPNWSDWKQLIEPVLLKLPMRRRRAN